MIYFCFKVCRVMEMMFDGNDMSPLTNFFEKFTLIVQKLNIIFGAWCHSVFSITQAFPACDFKLMMMTVVEMTCHFFECIF